MDAYVRMYTPFPTYLLEHTCINRNKRNLTLHHGADGCYTETTPFTVHPNMRHVLTNTLVLSFMQQNVCT